MNGNARWLQWVLGILITISLGISSYAITKADRAVQKEDYRIDVQRIETELRCINVKLDRIIEYKQK